MIWHCKIIDCNKTKHQAFGYCNTHYQQYYRYGNPLIRKARPHEKHGMERSREYACWLNMKQRCLNPKSTAWENYGGRGITICEQWVDSFVMFYKDMGDCPDGLTIERIDVNGNYEPLNCKWATVAEQNLNQRIRKDNKSGVRGVSFDKNKQRWIVIFKGKYFGAFKSFNDAVNTRQRVEIKT